MATCNIIAGKSGVGPITQFDTTNYKTKIGAEVKDFDAAQYMEKREVKTMDRFLHFAIACGKMAIEDSGLPLRFEGEDAERTGCYVGAGLGGLTETTVPVEYKAPCPKKK